MKIPVGNGTQSVPRVLRNEPLEHWTQVSEVKEKLEHWLGLLALNKQVWLVAEYQYPVLHWTHLKVFRMILALLWS